MFVMATHYGEHDLTWLTDYTDEYIVYDRSGCNLAKSITRDNIGDADYDKLSYLVDNYDKLPDIFLITKSNLFKFITPEEWEVVKDARDFTPILTTHHKTYGDAQGPVCFYDQGIYHERNNSWYLGSVPAKHFRSFDEFADAFDLPSPPYLPFAPGGSYITTRERVHRYPKEFYERLRDLLPYSERPGEAMMIERSYYMLWQ